MDGGWGSELHGVLLLSMVPKWSPAWVKQLWGQRLNPRTLCSAQDTASLILSFLIPGKPLGSSYFPRSQIVHLSDRESPQCNTGNWSVTRFERINPNKPTAIMVIGKLRDIKEKWINSQNVFSNEEISLSFVVYTGNRKWKKSKVHKWTTHSIQYAC